MKTTSLKLSALASALILAGCGGSSTTETASITTDSLSKISGTVPGTLIEAFCVDGSYYQVTSDDDGSDEHPFELEVPSTVSCSLVMTTNEDDPDNKVITQIGMITSDANGTLFTASEDIDLGYIPLAMNYSDIDDETGDHVSDDILTIQVDGTTIEIELEDNPLDDDDDGLVNVYEDDDGDGTHNGDDDDDDDKDGIDIDDDRDDDGIDDDEDVDDDNDGETDTNIVLPTTYVADAGRLLGSQCAQCHGTNGVSVNEWDSIAGEDDIADEIFDDEPIMTAQAHGYTSEEITLIGNWLTTLNNSDD